MQRYCICDNFFLFNGGCDCVIKGFGFIMEFKVCSFVVCLCKLRGFMVCFYCIICYEG